MALFTIGRHFETSTKRNLINHLKAFPKWKKQKLYAKNENVLDGAILDWLPF
jgi:hypothetical protein